MGKGLFLGNLKIVKTVFIKILQPCLCLWKLKHAARYRFNLCKVEAGAKPHHQPEGADGAPPQAAASAEPKRASPWQEFCVVG